MAGYLDLPGGSVWYDQRGAGDPLVLVHGGAVDSRFFDHNVGLLAERFRVITTDLWGHGRTADRDGDFSYDSFATDVEGLIERVVGEPAHIVGHSIGSVVALAVAMRRPEPVRRLVMVSGAFHHEAEIGGEGGVSDEQVEQTVAFLGASYGEVSPDGTTENSESGMARYSSGVCSGEMMSSSAARSSSRSWCARPSSSAHASNF